MNTTNIKYIVLLLLLTGCATPSKHDQFQDALNGIQFDFKTTLQAYDDEKMSNKTLTDSIQNIFRPYCRRHQGLKYVVDNTMPMTYPVQVFCNDGHTLKVYAPNV